MQIPQLGHEQLPINVYLVSIEMVGKEGWKLTEISLLYELSSLFCILEHNCG